MPSLESDRPSQPEGEINQPVPFVETGEVIEQELIQSVLHQGNRFSIFYSESEYTIEAYNQAGERVMGIALPQIVFDATLHAQEHTLPRPTPDQASQENIDPYSLIIWEENKAAHMQKAVVEGKTITIQFGGLVLGEGRKINRKNTFEIDTQLSFSSYTRNRLIQAGFHTLDDMRFGARHNLFPQVTNLGEKGLREIEEAGFPLWHPKPRRRS